MLVSDIIVDIGEKLLKQLSDGEWHMLGELLPCADILPPEASSQKYILSLSKEKREEYKGFPLEDQVEKGRKTVVTRKLNQWIYAGILEREGTGFQRRYRKIPDAEYMEAKKEKETQAREIAEANVIPGDHQVLRHYNNSRHRSRKRRLSLSYGDDGITIGNGRVSKTYLSIEHVVAFLDGVEFNDKARMDE